MTSESFKNTLRSEMKTHLSTLPQSYRQTSATICCTSLKGSIPWRDARAILLYLAFGNELNSDPVVEAAVSEGKAVFTPAVKDGDMEFRRVLSLDGPFHRGVFGIREPQINALRWSPVAIPGPTLVLVPGLAFDSSGGRLGRGGGYYDRFISAQRLEAAASGEQPPLFIGYAYAAQTVDLLPLEAHDEKLDGLITEKGIRLF